MTSDCPWEPPQLARWQGGPRPRRVRLRSEDGFVSWDTTSDRRWALRRLSATKELLRSPDPGGPGSDLHAGLVFGAMRGVFGHPHDVHDDLDSSSSWVLRLDVEPARLGRSEAPARLVLYLRDWRGAVRTELRMPRRGPRDRRLETGDDLLPGDLRELAVRWLVDYLEDHAAITRLPDFQRAYPLGDEVAYTYGVRDGVPFDDAPPPVTW